MSTLPMNDGGISLPSLKKLGIFSVLLVVLFGLFVAVYFGCNHISTLRNYHFPMYFDWELGLPFVPSMIYAYMSLNAIFFLPLFVCSIDSMYALAKAYIASLGGGALVFLVFPGQLGFERPAFVEGYNDFFQEMYTIDKPHNLVPSLHITFSLLFFMIISYEAKRKWVTAICAIWFVAISASVVLVRQHHIADIVGGIILAWGCYKHVYLKARQTKNVA